VLLHGAPGSAEDWQALLPQLVDFSSVSGVLFVAFLVSVLLAGLYGALLSLREGRYAPTLEPGGVPVELRQGNPPGPGGA
jgi:hypothetical protein